MGLSATFIIMVDENHFVIVFCRCLECMSSFAFGCYLTQGKCIDAIEAEVIGDDVILKTIWRGNMYNYNRECIYQSE